MTKKSLALLWIFASWFCASTWSHITGITLIELTDGRQIFLMHDSDQGASELDNQMNAVIIAQGVRKTAELNPSNRLELSFMDPAVYDVGDKLIKYLPLLSGHLKDDLFAGHFLSLVAKEPGLLLFDVMSFKKPEGITTFATGELVKTLALFEQKSWPINLKIRSNEPRHQHYLALIKQKGWLEKNGDILRMSDLLKPSWNLREKGHFFEGGEIWTEEFINKIKNRIQALKKTEDAQVLAFAKYVEHKTGNYYSPEILMQPISYFKDKIDLEIVYDFLAEQEFDVYAETPILDILLTLFKNDRPDFCFVILRNDYALKFVEVLEELNVVKEKSMGDVTRNLANLFTGLK